ncbi:hypothetical protein [Legionella fallonii]|uniref:Substrate of the Dot/Icm secretion system n=1 Tax=Legionella fallonii LLAP-10 TaxID=1212491 RepID=A0A098FZX3_9GAMM|nr:hypothetical protein [Legionella fallonii]CEG55778.1 conserved protein of unknown function [Legionella fallonii LLAP-10]
MPAPTLPANLKDPLFKCMEVSGTTIEGSQYFADQFKGLLIATKTQDQFSDLLNRVQDFAKYTAFKLRSSSEPWLGQINDSSDYKKMQAEMALSAARDLDNMKLGTSNKAAFEFAISDKSEFLRGYSADGQALDPKSLGSMDTLFNSYLAEHNMVSEGSVLYEATDQGKPKKDAQGVAIKADPQQVRDLINDPQQGYAKYLEGKGVNVTCQEQQYPSPQKDMQAQQAVKDAVAVKESLEASSVEVETPTAETQSTMKAGG